MPTVQELLEIKDRVEGDLLARPGVTGVDVGFKEVAGRLTDRLAIRIHVDVKSDLVPADQRVPAQIEGAETDVLERRYELHVAVRKAAAVAPREDTERHGSLVGGISMGPSREVDGLIFAGTLGATLVDGTGGGRAALTNFHVACVDSHFQLGDRMVQPSRIDGGSVPDDEFGSLLRQILGPQVDGAVIAIDADHPSEPGVLGLGAVQGLNTALQIGMGVHKRGRTTELTHGSVDGIGLTVTIDYGFDIGPRTLINQISIVPDTSRNPKFSDHGDSGSLVLDDGGLALGLLFAGSAASTLANPIDAVLSDLDLTLLLGGHGVLTELPDVLSVGAFATPDDGFQHVVVATADGAIHELYWRGGQPAGRGLLATLPGAVSVAGYVSSDGFRHTIVATSDGDVHELYWQDGAPGQGVLTNLPGVVSVGGYFGGDGFQHVIAATDDGNVHELYWQDGAPGQGVLANLPASSRSPASRAATVSSTSSPPPTTATSTSCTGRTAHLATAYSPT